GQVERAVKWARRNPAVACLTTALALLLTSLAVLSTGAAVHFAGLNVELTEARDEAAGEATRAVTALQGESKAREAESRARRQAQEQQKIAAASEDLARARLARLYLENGRLARETDPALSLLWYAEAWREDQKDPVRAEAHRARVLDGYRRLPRPVLAVTTGESGS